MYRSERPWWPEKPCFERCKRLNAEPLAFEDNTELGTMRTPGGNNGAAMDCSGQRVMLCQVLHQLAALDCPEPLDFSWGSFSLSLLESRIHELPQIHARPFLAAPLQLP